MNALTRSKLEDVSMDWEKFRTINHTFSDVIQDEMKKTTNANRNAQLNLAMLNNGIHSGTRFVVGAFHTENDIFRTAEAFDKSLRELRSEGLI